MDYAMFKAINTANKGKCVQGRVVSTDFKKGICVVFVTVEKSILIENLIRGILAGKFCISNPSVFSKYNFDKLKKKKEVKQVKRGISSSIKIKEDMLAQKDLLFHGSDGGIQGEERFDCNAGLCDFGKGFYTGYDIRQAENRVSNKSKGMLYAYSYDFDNLRVYRFEDTVLWALYVGYNRRLITIKSDKLLRIFKHISSSDIVIGYIADDKISRSFNEFISGYITDKCLAECLKLVKYGKQVVFKTDRAMKHIKRYGHYELTKDMKEESKRWGRSVKSDMDTNIDKIKSKYRRIGRFLEEIMEDYE